MQKETVEAFKNVNVLVVGDLMLDTYYWGSINRMSPEAPVPIVSVNKIERRLGGAGNVISNLKSLGAIPFIASVLGKDNTSEYIQSLISQEGISIEAISHSAERISTEKIRIINHTDHIVRCDIESENDLSKEEEQTLLNNIKNCLLENRIGVIILQDYNKGVLTKNIIESVIELAKEHQIPVTVDPKKKNFFAYKNVFLFKPNLKEVREALDMNIDPKDQESLVAAAKQLFQELHCENVFITLSEYGAFFMNRKGNYRTIPAHQRNIVDVSGAGDTVISVAALCVANAFPIEEIASISNLAGGIVCEQPGVACLSLDKLVCYL